MAAILLLAGPGSGFAESQVVPRALALVGAGTAGNGGPGVFEVGGGVECAWEPGIGVLAEVGWISPFDAPGERVGLLSANAIVWLGGARRRSRVRPFVTGGYGMAFSEAAVHMANAGAGIDWSLGRVAWRVEVRDHFMFGERGHVWRLRTGLVFQ